MNLTRAKFNELTAHLVERTVTPVTTALKDAGLTASDLSKVLLSAVPQESRLYRIK